MSDVFGDGIFVNDGDRWKSTRQCTSRIFHVNSFRNVIMPSLEQGLRSLCKTLHYKAEQDLDVDFCSIFYKFTLESFIKMTFGKDLNILEAETRSDPHSLSSSSIEFASAFDYAQNQLDWRFVVMTGWSILENVFSSKGNKMRAACKTLDNFVYALIDGKQIPDVSENPDNGHDLLELFMKAKDDTGRSLQRTELRDAVLNLIVAGRDTTAQALAWAFFHLIMNTHLIKRILEEIDELGEDVTYDNHKQYTWTQAVICEALRLHPSVPKNMKFAINSDRIPGGPIIQPGDAVRWGDWQMGRDSRIWGPDCGEFKAERWIDSEGKLKQVGQFKFHAFNGGPRLCLGMTLAMLQAVAVTVRILKNFHLEFAPGWLDGVSMSDPIPGVKTSYPTPRYKPSLTHPMDQPMLIRLRARAQS